MPQMAPINWLSLFIVFCLTMVVFSSMNYYLFITPAPKTYKMLDKKSSSLNWKW